MIRVVEVGPRDGLQNEPTPIPTSVKAKFIRDLHAAGLTEIEATSFVHPKWVPQLADAAELLQEIGDVKAKFSALIPNMKGLERAIELKLDRIALFTAASDAFTQKNINQSVAESITAFSEVATKFREVNPKAWIRGYVSTIVECPYAGKIEPKAVADVAKKLIDLGVDEISLGDTIGVAVPSEIHRVAEAIEDVVEKSKVAWHFHDTRGTAISNVAAMLEQGYTAFDSSAGGLGGCPYAHGAGGNLATEDLVYFLQRYGLATDLDLLAIARSSLPVLEAVGRPRQSKVQIAILAACD
ncbi:hydroxymethylglutaryl-CoA lyase [Kamptonema cortianum]|nr:hydroxymethylglutaryl-CoA lyase [Geitlerinema splendidum]MDK3161065.1 hydroxymethylglutaryl-CoA lyase [Kamptonema cortianum]